jgi:putative endonuclease
VSPVPPVSPGSRGRWAEGLALDYLRDRGLKARTSNYRCRIGEIDLIMEDGKTIVFVEVRYRRHYNFGNAFETVDRRKRSKVLSTASHYLQNTPGAAGRPCRFDVVSVSGQDGEHQLHWIPDAFEV